MGLTDYVIMPGADYQAACDAIRAKTGKTDAITSGDMSAEIEGIEAGGGSDVVTAFIDRSITEISDSSVTVIGNNAFHSCYKLISADFPAVTSIGNNAFYSCYAMSDVNFPSAANIGQSAFYWCNALTTVSFPAVTRTNNSAFYQCEKLESVDFPAITQLGDNTFYGCSKLSTVNLPVATTFSSKVFYNCTGLAVIDLPSATSISAYVFYGCAAMTALILRKSDAACTLSSSLAFDNNTPIQNGTCYIYVPSALVDTYKAATNWSTYADQFRALEDYTVDGTTTGELDETKI